MEHETKHGILLKEERVASYEAGPVPTSQKKKKKTKNKT